MQMKQVLTLHEWELILYPIPPLRFSVNKSETVKDVSFQFSVFSNFSLETFVPNFISLTWLNLQILGKTQTGVFPISVFLVNPLSTKFVIIPEPVMTMA